MQKLQGKDGIYYIQPLPVLCTSSLGARLRLKEKLKGKKNSLG